jgi:lincosamide nucleotidyltransferase B/F
LDTTFLSGRVLFFQGVSMKELLLKRLNKIAQSLEDSNHALALIGLGSVGLELERIDEHSDLDFFAIVENGFKQDFLQNLEWLTSLASVAYVFQNTQDGFKLLFEDGVFCEFAVFEMPELANIPFAAGRIVWKKTDINQDIASPKLESVQHQHSLVWNLGEALTNILIGVKRFYRGEKLSAARFVQQYAVDRVLELQESLQTTDQKGRDPFNPERRLEQRHPEMKAYLSTFVQGYERTPESALAILAWLEQHFEINQGIVKTIKDLILQRSQHNVA